MALRTLSETLDNLYTSTWQNMKDTVRDQIFDATPFFFWLRDKGKLMTQAGGRYITEPLQYFKNDSVTWIGKGDAVSLNDFEFLTTAKFDWKYQVGTIVRFLTDDQQNRGKHQILSLMNAKMENTQNALIDDLETTLFAGAASGKEWDGLQILVADDPTAAAAAAGGIDPSVYTWFQSKTKNMTGSSFASNGVGEMRTMLNNCSNNLRMDKPDILLSGQTPYEYYEDVVFGKYRTENNRLADAGFTNQTFKGIPMLWSPACANTRMYFLNTNFIKFVYDPMLYFDMTDWKQIPDQPGDRAAQIVTACSLTVSRRRCHGVIYNIDTA